MPARYQCKKDFPRLTQRCTDLGGSFIYKYAGRRMLGSITVKGRGQAVAKHLESKVYLKTLLYKGYTNTYM